MNPAWIDRIRREIHVRWALGFLLLFAFFAWASQWDSTSGTDLLVAGALVVVALIGAIKRLHDRVSNYQHLISLLIGLGGVYGIVSDGLNGLYFVFVLVGLAGVVEIGYAHWKTSDRNS